MNDEQLPENYHQTKLTVDLMLENKELMKKIAQLKGLIDGKQMVIARQSKIIEDQHAEILRLINERG